MLVVESVRKQFGDIIALDGVSLQVNPGQLVGFLGPNGAGKTSTMRVIMGLVSPDAGSVSWNGERISGEHRHAFGYMPAERGMYPKMTVRRQLIYFARLAGRSRSQATAATEAWMQRLQIDARADDEVQTLSSGNQQRVQLAIALVHEPQLLILDEPFSGLDPMAVETMKTVLAEQISAGRAVLFSSHQLDLVSDICRDVVIINEGKVVLTGDVDQIRQQSTVRYASVSFAEHVNWSPANSTVQVVAATDNTVKLKMPVGVQPIALLNDASSAGTVVQFTFTPPDLSEVFLASVGASNGQPE